MSGDDREPIGRKGKKAQPKAAPKRPLRRRRDEDEYEEDYDEEQMIMMTRRNRCQEK